MFLGLCCLWAWTLICVSKESRASLSRFMIGERKVSMTRVKGRSMIWTLCLHRPILNSEKWIEKSPWSRGFCEIEHELWFGEVAMNELVWAFLLSWRWVRKDVGCFPETQETRHHRLRSTVGFQIGKNDLGWHQRCRLWRNMIESRESLKFGEVLNPIYSLRN